MQYTIMAVVGAITTTLHYIIYPVILLAKGLFSVVCFLLIPFVHLGRAILFLSLVPVRILAKFESLYIFLAVAALIGVAAGLSLNILHRSIGQVVERSSSDSKRQFLEKGSKLLDGPAQILRFRQWNQPRSPGEDFSTSSYPRSKEKAFSVGSSVNKDGNKSRSSDLLADWTSSKDKIMRDSGLFSTTILEEDDDNDNDDSEDF